MPKIVKQSDDISDDELPYVVKEYVDMKGFVKQTTERFDKLKMRIRRYIQMHGEPDDKGSLWVKIDGLPDMKLEKRVSSSFDLSKAETWLKANKPALLKACLTTETRTFLDEEKVLAAGYQKKIPTNIMEGFYVESSTYAMTKP